MNHNSREGDLRRHLIGKRYFGDISNNELNDVKILFIVLRYPKD